MSDPHGRYLLMGSWTTCKPVLKAGFFWLPRRQAQRINNFCGDRLSVQACKLLVQGANTARWRSPLR